MMMGLQSTLLLLALRLGTASQAPSGLLVDLKPAPHAGLEQPRPRLSWIVPHLSECNGAGQLQSHFQVQLSKTADFADLLADSKRVASTASLAVGWPGPDLEPAQVYWWRVRTWANACQSEWSEAAKVITGNFGQDFAVAKPIWLDGARYLFARKQLALESGKFLVSAHVFAAAVPVGDGKEKYLGAYRLYVDDVVAAMGPGRGTRQYSQPGHPDYDTVDVTKLLVGKRATTMALQGFHDKGDAGAKALVELHLKYDDGSEQVVGTDSSWSAFDADELFLGASSGLHAIQGPEENFDARLSPSGDGCVTCWRQGSFSAGSAWKNATERAAFAPALRAKITQPIEVTPGMEPERIVQLAPGHWFVDFGTELMGGVELEWTAGNATINVRASEELVTNTSILFPMRTGNVYEMDWTAGEGKSSFEQHEYWGFRYLEMKVSSANLTFMCDLIPPQTDEGQMAGFQCPEGQTIKAVTFASFGTPTGQCTAEGGNTFAINEDCHAKSSQSVVENLCLGKHSCSFSASNSVFGEDPCHKTSKGFAGAVECSGAAAHSNELPFKLSAWVVHYPWVESDSSFSSSNDMLNSVWELCRNTLKVTSLDTTTDSNTRERLPYEADGLITGSSRYVFQREFAWQRHSTQHNMLNPTWPTEWRQTLPLLALSDFLVTGDTSLGEENWDFLAASSQAHCIGASGLVDFSTCSRPDGVRDIVDWPKLARDGYEMTDVNTVVNAYAVGGLNALATLANATGNASTASTLQQKAQALSGAMKEHLFDEASGLFKDGLGGKAASHSAWHAQVFPLFFGAGGAESSKQILTFLKSKRMVGSVYAAFAFVLGLYNLDTDHGAFALEMMTTCDDNSWCNMLRQGATAVMEAWTREEKPNLSWSHPWASAPATAIAQGLMGINVLEPGYRRFEVRPQPGGLAWAELKLPVLAGFIITRVEQPKGSCTLRLTVPGNTEATVCLPTLQSTSSTLAVDGVDKAGYKSGDFYCVDGIGSGQHVIVRAANQTVMV